MILTRDEHQALLSVTTATLTTVMLKKGVSNVWIRGAFPLRAGQSRVVGPAFTMRFIPARDDLSTPESLASATSTRTAIEAMPDGCIAVVAADGCHDAGIFGDILCERMKQRHVQAVVTDGVVRDLEGVLETEMPVWAAGAAAPPSFSGLTFVGWNDPIGCGGAAIFPNDIIVADKDGAVIIPQAMVSDVCAAAIEQEKMEEWILAQVKSGTPLPGLYPPNEDNKARYEAWKKSE